MTASTRFVPITDVNEHAPHLQKYMRVPSYVALRAAEVYEEVFGNPARVLKDGFSAMELAGFLYARSFPRAEWRARFHEAIRTT